MDNGMSKAVSTVKEREEFLACVLPSLEPAEVEERTTMRGN